MQPVVTSSIVMPKSKVMIPVEFELLVLVDGASKSLPVNAEKIKFFIGNFYFFVMLFLILELSPIPVQVVDSLPLMGIIRTKIDR